MFGTIHQGFSIAHYYYPLWNRWYIIATAHEKCFDRGPGAEGRGLGILFFSQRRPFAHVSTIKSASSAWDVQAISRFIGGVYFMSARFALYARIIRVKQMLANYKIANCFGKYEEIIYCLKINPIKTQIFEFFLYKTKISTHLFAIKKYQKWYICMYE